MVSELFFYQLGLIALVWLCVLLHWVWPNAAADACPTTPTPSLPKVQAMPVSRIVPLAYTPLQPHPRASS
jgi:hypothetical protein